MHRVPVVYTRNVFSDGEVFCNEHTVIHSECLGYMFIYSTGTCYWGLKCLTGFTVRPIFVVAGTGTGTGGGLFLGLSILFLAG